MSLEQLKNFCEFESKTHNKTHIAQWALAEIERKDAALRVALDALKSVKWITDETEAAITTIKEVLK
jgi:hypothetical protein